MSVLEQLCRIVDIRASCRRRGKIQIEEADFIHEHKIPRLNQQFGNIVWDNECMHPRRGYSDIECIHIDPLPIPNPNSAYVHSSHPGGSGKGPGGSSDSGDPDKEFSTYDKLEQFQLHRSLSLALFPFFTIFNGFN